MIKELFNSAKEKLIKNTLHEAIIIVLRDSTKGLTASQIAKEINMKRLYFRKDRTSVPSSQIHARVNKYPNLFIKEGDKIKLKY